MLPQDLLYSEEGEWVRLENDFAFIGIALPFAERLGPLMEVELPEPGEEIEQTIEMGSIEGKRSFKEFFAPLSGTVEEVNYETIENSARILDDPYGDGWLLKISIRDREELDTLLSAEDMKLILEKLEDLEEEEGEEFDEFEE